MNSSEWVIYCIQFVIVVFGFLYLEKRYKFLPLHIFLSLSLLITSILLAMLSAKVAELDSRKYIKDAVLLISFLDKDNSLYGLFFLTGGNSLYPQHYYPMLIASNTWSNYTSYTIEKFYLFFALISKPNLYNVSLFFGALSFMSKALLLKTFYHLDKYPTKLKLLCLFLMVGGLEIYFVSGVYKENLLLLFISFMLYTYYSGPKIWKYVIACICFVHAVFIRLDTMVIMMIVGIAFYLWKQYKYLAWKRYIWAVFLSCFALLGLYHSPYREYVLKKFIRYAKLEKGSTHFDTIDWAICDETTFVQVLNRWKQALYSVFTTPDYLWIVNLSGAITLLFIVVMLSFQTKKWHTLTLFTAVNFFSFLCVVSLFVPNYMALLRYRSPLLVLFVFGCILNLNPQSLFLKYLDRLFHKLSLMASKLLKL